MKQITINNGVLSAKVIEYGAVLQEFIHLPTGRNLVVGLPEVADYFEDIYSLGACVGRFAGRISGGHLMIDGQRYPLNTKQGIHLHGGQRGFSHKFWTIQEVVGGKTPHVTLSYLSRHLEEGYPGNLECKVTYRLSHDKLEIIHEARTDQTTVVNMTNHSYFRLDDEQNVKHYELQLNADRILKTQENLLPTGDFLEVANSPYDFRAAKRIGSLFLDTPFVLNASQEVQGQLYSPKSRIGLKVYTNQPAVIIYTPLDFPGVCLETQNFPDAPAFDHFPSAELQPGALYRNYAAFEVFSNP